MAPPINPPNHPPTHQTIHPPIGGGVSTDFKSSNRIKISWFVQVLLNFYWFGGSPRWGGGGCRVKWGFGDDVGMTGMMWGWHDMGMTWGRWRWHGEDGEDREDLHPLTHPLTHPSIQPWTHPWTHPWLGVSQQIINLQTELNYLD